MAQTRYDDKGRSLLPNEYQKEDGRYEYRYIDLNGVRRSVYSWKLKRSDQTVGKNQDEICLRDIEKQLSRDKQDGIDTYTAKRMSLNSLFDDYIQDRPLKTSTRTNYKYMYNKYIRETLGVRNIADIHYSDILRFYRSLIIEIGFKPQSMEVIHTILHPIFSLAVRDGYIRVNPTDGIMREIRAQYNWETERRRALTEEQQTHSSVMFQVRFNTAIGCHFLPFCLGQADALVKYWDCGGRTVILTAG